jgi:peptide deformylase
MEHEDYITHVKNKEDTVYLKTKHFPVNMRLFNTSRGYQYLIREQCAYIRELCLTVKDGYKKPHGMSSANAGLSFNIIGITRNRNQVDEYCQIMINPVIISRSIGTVETTSNCGSITLDEPIKLTRNQSVVVQWYDEEGVFHDQLITREQGAFTVQHEVDHNLGILITDYL